MAIPQVKIKVDEVNKARFYSLKRGRTLPIAQKKNILGVDKEMVE